MTSPDITEIDILVTEAPSIAEDYAPSDLISAITDSLNTSLLNIKVKPLLPFCDVFIDHIPKMDPIRSAAASTLTSMAAAKKRAIQATKNLDVMNQSKTAVSVVLDQTLDCIVGSQVVRITKGSQISIKKIVFKFGRTDLCDVMQALNGSTASPSIMSRINTIIQPVDIEIDLSSSGPETQSEVDRALTVLGLTYSHIQNSAAMIEVPKSFDAILHSSQPKQARVTRQPPKKSAAEHAADKYQLEIASEMSRVTNYRFFEGSPPANMSDLRFSIYNSGLYPVFLDALLRGKDRLKGWKKQVEDGHGTPKQVRQFYFMEVRRLFRKNLMITKLQKTTGLTDAELKFLDKEFDKFWDNQQKGVDPTPTDFLIQEYFTAIDKIDRNRVLSLQKQLTGGVLDQICEHRKEFADIVVQNNYFTAVSQLEKVGIEKYGANLGASVFCKICGETITDNPTQSAIFAIATESNSVFNYNFIYNLVQRQVIFFFTDQLTIKNATKRIINSLVRHTQDVVTPEIESIDIKIKQIKTLSGIHYDKLLNIYIMIYVVGAVVQLIFMYPDLIEFRNHAAKQDEVLAMAVVNGDSDSLPPIEEMDSAPAAGGKQPTETRRQNLSDLLNYGLALIRRYKIQDIEETGVLNISMLKGLLTEAFRQISQKKYTIDTRITQSDEVFPHSALIYFARMYQLIGKPTAGPESLEEILKFFGIRLTDYRKTLALVVPEARVKQLAGLLSTADSTDKKHILMSFLRFIDPAYKFQESDVKQDLEFLQNQRTLHLIKSYRPYFLIGKTPRPITFTEKNVSVLSRADMFVFKNKSGEVREIPRGKVKTMTAEELRGWSFQSMSRKEVDPVLKLFYSYFVHKCPETGYHDFKGTSKSIAVCVKCGITHQIIENMDAKFFKKYVKELEKIRAADKLDFQIARVVPLKIPKQVEKAKPSAVKSVANNTLYYATKYKVPVTLLYNIGLSEHKYWKDHLETDDIVADENPFRHGKLVGYIQYVISQYRLYRNHPMLSLGSFGSISRKDSPFYTQLEWREFFKKHSSGELNAIKTLPTLNVSATDYMGQPGNSTYMINYLFSCIRAIENLISGGKVRTHLVDKLFNNIMDMEKFYTVIDIKKSDRSRDSRPVMGDDTGADLADEFDEDMIDETSVIDQRSEVDEDEEYEADGDDDADKKKADIGADVEDDSGDPFSMDALDLDEEGMEDNVYTDYADRG
jgi:hypothetical protein